MINIVLMNQNMILYYSLSICKCPEYHQHQYFYDQLRYHTHIHLDLFVSYDHLKNLLKCFTNTPDNQLI